jgi:hypothetical protein
MIFKSVWWVCSCFLLPQLKKIVTYKFILTLPHIDVYCCCSCYQSSSILTVIVSTIIAFITTVFHCHHFRLFLSKKFKVIRVTGYGGPQSCETSRFPDFLLDNRLLDHGEVVRLNWQADHTAAGRIRPIEKSDNLIGSRTHNRLASDLLPHPATLPCPLFFVCLT